MISAGLFAFSCTCLAALFEVHSFPLPDPHAHVLLANADSDKTADVFVLDGLLLTAYPSAANYAPVVIPLADGTSAFDIADLDGDGKNEVMAVCHDRILRYSIPTNGTAPPGEELFSLKNYLGPSTSPYPQVLVVKHEGRSVLALPSDDTVELREADGALASKYEASERTFVGAADKTRLGPLSFSSREDDLELDVWMMSEIEPKSPSPGSPFPPLPSVLTGRKPERRPFPGGRQGRVGEWFPLKKDGTTLLRAVCEERRRGLRTIVRIREAKSDEDDFLDKNITLGPERTYAGALISYGEYYPDFNGDGYVDLTLWKAPSPGMSVDSLTRAITGGVWPIDMVFHLFSPEKKRFEPTPWSHIALTAPVSWFLEGGPVRNEVFGDFNGDKRTDFALGKDNRTYAAWLSTKKGFPQSPDFEYSLPEDIRDVFCADLDGAGSTSIGLRTAKNLYLLRARP
jgi:hypothetical protein